MVGDILSDYVACDDKTLKERADLRAEIGADIRRNRLFTKDVQNSANIQSQKCTEGIGNAYKTVLMEKTL